MLLLIEPNEGLFDIVKNYFGSWIFKNGKKVRQYFDMDIINQRLACHGQLVVLPKHYGTLNSEYLKSAKLSDKMRPCKNFSQVQFLHFSELGKPWSHHLSNYVGLYEDQVQPLIQTWFKTAKEICPESIKL